LEEKIKEITSTDIFLLLSSEEKKGSNSFETFFRESSQCATDFKSKLMKIDIWD
jgi:hypothetical protein